MTALMPDRTLGQIVADIDKAKRDLRKLERQARDTPKRTTAAKCDSLIASVRKRLVALEQEERDLAARPKPQPVASKPAARPKPAPKLSPMEGANSDGLDIPDFLRRY